MEGSDAIEDEGGKTTSDWRPAASEHKREKAKGGRQASGAGTKEDGDTIED